jgi:hypothetical protein
MTTVDCACVIHGDAYGWVYVDRLFNMLKANCSYDIRLHVFTEASREVPEPYIKHTLTEWTGIAGPRKSWWYKMQMFNSEHFQGRLLYLDLDTVITKNLDWMWDTSESYFWSIRDFKYLWRSHWNTLNSSVMLWDTKKYHWVWDKFAAQNINALVRLFHGDQDFLASILNSKEIRFFDTNAIKSWRWEVKDGGLDMKTQLYRQPGAGSLISPATCIMVFHGKPKPHQIKDSVIDKYWK